MGGPQVNYKEGSDNTIDMTTTLLPNRSPGSLLLLANVKYTEYERHQSMVKIWGWVSVILNTCVTSQALISSLNSSPKHLQRKILYSRFLV